MTVEDLLDKARMTVRHDGAVALVAIGLGVVGRPRRHRGRPRPPRPSGLVTEPGPGAADRAEVDDVEVSASRAHLLAAVDLRGEARVHFWLSAVDRPDLASDVDALPVRGA